MGSREPNKATEINTKNTFYVMFTSFVFATCLKCFDLNSALVYSMAAIKFKFMAAQSVKHRNWLRK